MRGVTSTRRGRWSGDRGSAMVELVVVLPILLIVLFAFVELSRAWFTLQIAMMAAREGARAAAVAPLNFEATDGQARIDAVFADYNFSATTPGFSRTVTKAAVTGTTDFEVVATVNVRFSTLFPVLLPRLQTIDMSEQVKMRYECNPSIKPCSPPP